MTKTRKQLEAASAREARAVRDVVLEICETFEIWAYSEALSDGSRVWNVSIGDGDIACLSQKQAEALAVEIGEAIMRATR